MTITLIFGLQYIHYITIKLYDLCRFYILISFFIFYRIYHLLLHFIVKKLYFIKIRYKS